MNTRYGALATAGTPAAIVKRLQQEIAKALQLNAVREKLVTRVVDTHLPTSARTYDFYAPLLAPAFASANLFSLSSQRKTGNVELNLGNRLPFDMTLSYKNEIKDGYRGLSSVNIRERVSSVTEVASPLDEMTYDLGVRAARNFKSGSPMISSGAPTTPAADHVGQCVRVRQPERVRQPGPDDDARLRVPGL